MYNENQDNNFENNDLNTENSVNNDEKIYAESVDAEQSESLQQSEKVQDIFFDGASYVPENSDNKNITNSYEWNANQNDGKKVKKRSGLQVFTAVMLCIFTVSFLAVAGMLAFYLIPQKNTITNTNYSQSTNVKPGINAGSGNFAAVIPDNSSALTIPQIASKCSPSAVGIVTEVETTYNYGFFSQQGKATSMGSGFILNSDGYVITNHHVIDGANKITVIMNDSNNTEIEATLVGSDSISDIAVLKITAPEGIGILPVEIGNSDEIVVGESVIAIGCPAGIEFIGTVTDGIVSAINRNVEITDSYGRIQKTMTLIQTNATINKGNSGGPLINSKGQVIGINTLKLTSEYEGIGFSIPINGAMPIINQLIEHGKVIERTEEDFAYGLGVIGISGSAVSQDEADYYGIPLGVLIFQIDKNSSAAKAGLRRGDIITAYNGTAVKTVDDINNLKAKNRAGETVTVTVYRDSESGKAEGDTFDISFKLDPQN